MAFDHFGQRGGIGTIVADPEHRAAYRRNCHWGANSEAAAIIAQRHHGGLGPSTFDREVSIGAFGQQVSPHP